MIATTCILRQYVFDEGRKERKKEKEWKGKTLKTREQQNICTKPPLETKHHFEVCSFWLGLLDIVLFLESGEGLRDA